MKGKVAIVTGAASGIGLATAVLLREEGAVVVGLDRAFGSSVDPFDMSVDITDRSAVTAAVDAIARRFGRIDMLVNNAGGGEGARLLEIQAAQWDALLSLNLSAAFFMTQAVVPHMGRGSAIVNIASLAARLVSPRGGAAYAAAKAGVVALSRQCAAELAPRGVRVNTILPGPVRSALTRLSTRVDADFPLGRWLTGQDVAHAVHFFLSERSAVCTGAELVLDGGTSLATK